MAANYPSVVDPAATAPLSHALQRDRDSSGHPSPRATPAGVVERSVEPSGIVVLFRETGRLRPLFVIAGLGGHVEIFRPLAELLDSDRPVYGLQGIGLDGRELPLKRIEAIADRYLREVTAIQPQGPYDLVGWSMGGIIAYEMGLQLLAAQRHLGALVIIDEFAPLRVPLKQRVAWHWRRWSEQSMRARVGIVLGILERRVIALGRRLGLHPPIEGLEGRAAKLVKENALAQYAAIRRYRPGQFPRDLAVIAADHSREAADPRAADPAMGWGPLVRGRIHTFTVPGSHGSIFSTEHVHALHAALQQCFEQIARIRSA